MCSSICRASRLPFFEAATSRTRAWSQFFSTPSPRRNRSASVTSAGTYPFLTPAHSKSTALGRSRCLLFPRKISRAELNSSCPVPNSAGVTSFAPASARICEVEFSSGFAGRGTAMKPGPFGLAVEAVPFFAAAGLLFVVPTALSGGEVEFGCAAFSFSLDALCGRDAAGSGFCAASC